MVFLGLSESNRETVEDFVRTYHIPWPNGYGASETVVSLVFGNPTVVVIGRDGRVFWNDGRLRYQHQPDPLPDALCQAIEAALAAEYDRAGGPAIAGG